MPDPVVAPLDTGRAEVDLRTGRAEEVGEGMLDPPPWRTEADWVVGFLLEGVGILLPRRGMLEGFATSVLDNLLWGSWFLEFLSTASFSTLSTLFGSGGGEAVLECISGSVAFCFPNEWLFNEPVSPSGDLRNGLVERATLVSSRVEWKGLGILDFGLGAGLGLSAVPVLEKFSCTSSLLFSVTSSSASGMESALGVIRGTTLGGGMRLAGAAVLKRGILEAVAGGDLGSDWGWDKSSVGCDMGEVCSFSTGEAQLDPSELCVAKRSKDTNSWVSPNLIPRSHAYSLDLCCAINLLIMIKQSRVNLLVVFKRSLYSVLNALKR